MGVGGGKELELLSSRVWTDLFWAYGELRSHDGAFCRPPSIPSRTHSPPHERTQQAVEIRGARSGRSPRVSTDLTVGEGEPSEPMLPTNASFDVVLRMKTFRCRKS